MGLVTNFVEPRPQKLLRLLDYFVLCFGSNEKLWPQTGRKYASFLIFFFGSLTFSYNYSMSGKTRLATGSLHVLHYMAAFGVYEYLNDQLYSLCLIYSNYAPIVLSLWDDSFIKSKTKIVTHTVRGSLKHSKSTK